jgi:alanine-synthesizing transaminase
MKKKDFLCNKLPNYIFAEIYRLKNQAIESGHKIIDFGMGNPDSSPPNHVIEELSTLCKNPNLYGYSTTGGIDQLKNAIADYYLRRFNVKIDPKTQALITIGSKEGIASLATAISNKGDICVPNPSYPIHNFAFVIARSSVIRIEALNSKIFFEKFVNYVENADKKPLAVIVSYPSNPTTETVDIGFYKAIVEFCKKHQIFIISDIAYCEIYFDDANKPHSILEVKGALDIAIEFSSVSKSYSLAGTRVGFAVGNDELIKYLLKIKSYLDYGSFTPLQMVAVSALSPKSDEYLINLRKLYFERIQYFIKKFDQELNWKIEAPKASMFIWAKLPAQFSNISSFDFCKDLILKSGIAISPGSSFGECGEGYVRFSMIRNFQEIDEMVGRLKKIISYKM